MKKKFEIQDGCIGRINMAYIQGENIMGKNSMKLLVVFLLSSLVFTACGKEDAPQKNEAFKNAKPNVKYSTYEKDGKKFASYDFGKAVFTVDRSYLNHFDESTIEMRWFWPGLIPIAAKGNTGIDTSKFSEVRIAADFSNVSRYPDVHNAFERENSYCKLSLDQKNDLAIIQSCFKEVDSEYAGCKKLIKGKKQDSIRYIADSNGAKNPEGNPLIILCSFDLNASMTHDLKEMHCGTNFHYYNQVSVAIQFRGDVMQHWQELMTQINTFFESRMQERIIRTPTN